MITRQLHTFACVLALFALGICSAVAGEKTDKKTSETETGSDVTVTNAAAETDDDTVIFTFNIAGQAQEGVPLLNKIPYLSRLFKNTGVRTTAQTAVIRVPKCQIESSESVCADKCVKPCAVGQAIEALASPTYVAEDVQYFPGTVQWTPLAAVKSRACAPAERRISVHACEAECNATCPVATKVACDECKCGAKCGCGKSNVAHVSQLHEKLVQALTENAQLKARVEMQHELAEQKEEFISEMVEARMEVVRLQARLEIASEREQLAQRQRLPQPVANPHHHDHPQHHPVTPVSERLRMENEALKARVAELEQQLAARPVATRVSNRKADGAKQPKR